MVYRQDFFGLSWRLWSVRLNIFIALVRVSRTFMLKLTAIVPHRPESCA